MLCLSVLATHANGFVIFLICFQHLLTTTAFSMSRIKISKNQISRLFKEICFKEVNSKWGQNIESSKMKNKFDFEKTDKTAQLANF